MDSDTETKVISFLDRRRAICYSCEHLTTYVGIKSCSKCGCAIWGKTMMRGQKCPEGKWNAEKD
jgi:hypothetical protein